MFVQGVKNSECFGFICKETERINNFYVSFIFKCESDSVATEVIKGKYIKNRTTFGTHSVYSRYRNHPVLSHPVLFFAVLRQALIATQKELHGQSICEHCPMQFFHLLCTEVEGLNDERVLATIVKRVESLPEADRVNILTKFNGAEPQSIAEQTELYMMLLRAYCESKQTKHIHDTTENRHEFLNQYLGGGAILLKAKRSLTQSFDQLLKKKGKDETTIKTMMNQNHNSQQNASLSFSSNFYVSFFCLFLLYSEILTHNFNFKTPKYTSKAKN